VRPVTARWSAGTPATSPPYGASLHGRVTARPGKGIAKSHNRYSTDRANLAHVGLGGLLDAMGTILAGCQRVLRPGGYVAMTVRPFWSNGRLVDLPGAMVRVGEESGLVLYERNVALLAGLRDDRLVPRCSFFALEQVRKARARGVPRQVIAHEDLLVFSNPQAATAPGKAAVTRLVHARRHEPARRAA